MTLVDYNHYNDLQLQPPVDRIDNFSVWKTTNSNDHYRQPCNICIYLHDDNDQSLKLVLISRYKVNYVP